MFARLIELHLLLQTVPAGSVKAKIFYGPTEASDKSCKF